MLLSDLLGRAVRAGGHLVGHVVDVRLLPEAPTPDQPMPTLRVYGLIVSPHSKASTLGYERSGVRSPWPVAALAGRRHRESFLVRWTEVASVALPGDVVLRPGHARYSPRLLRSAATPPQDAE